jgi:hypothetical protein
MSLGKEILRCQSGDFVLYLHHVPDTLPIEQRPRFGLLSKGNDDVYNFTIPRKVSLIKNYYLGFFIYICTYHKFLKIYKAR